MSFRPRLVLTKSTQPSFLIHSTSLFMYSPRSAAIGGALKRRRLGFGRRSGGTVGGDGDDSRLVGVEDGGRGIGN